jgi:dimethylaniline monooxygenase (N-oxide forming)
MAPDSDPGERFDARCAVIGAGPAGLSAGHAFAERGLTFEIFDCADTVGGMWQIDSPGSAAYETLQLNSSRTMTQFRCFPMPKSWPDFPTYRQMAEYLETFADEFHLRDHIHLGVTVDDVEPVPGPGLPGHNGWAVTTSDGQTRFFENVIVASGHHRTPRMPQLPGTFNGTVMHSRDYRSPDVFLTKRVLVVGAGNSGTDIATDAARRAERTLLATRYDLEVLPRRLLGRPFDQLRPGMASLLPVGVERSLFNRFVRVGAATEADAEKGDDQTTSGRSPAPPVADDLPGLVQSGDIEITAVPKRLSGDRVRFADGTSAKVDLIVFATGYDIDLPFLGHQIFDPQGSTLPLYRNVVAPQRPGLWFVGFVDTIGATLPLLEEQSEWIADVLTGAAVLPGRTAMRTWIDQAQRNTDPDAGHPLLVDYWRYQKALKQERGRRRTKPKLRDRLPSR